MKYPEFVLYLRIDFLVAECPSAGEKRRKRE